MRTKEQIFTHPSQLNTLSAIPFLHTSGLGTLRLGGSISEHPEIKRWENELNKYFYACGCDASAKSLVIALIAGSAWAGYSYFQGTWGVGTAIGTALSIAIGGAIVGKIFGLFRANGKLKQTVKEIQEQWQPEEKPETGHWTCG